MKILPLLILGASLNLTAVESPDPWAEWQSQISGEGSSDPALAGHFRDFRKSLQDNPENRVRLWNLGVEIAVKTCDPQLDEELFAQGEKLAPPLLTLPRQLAWDHLALRLSQSRRYVCAHSTRRGGIYAARGRQAFAEFLAFSREACAAGDLSDLELNRFQFCCDQLAALRGYINFAVAQDPAFVACRKAILDPAFASRLLRLSVQLGDELSPEVQVEARQWESRLHAGQATGSDERRREWLALLAVLAIPSGPLAAEVEPCLGTDAKQHELWALLLARSGPGLSGQLKEKMTRWADAPPNAEGQLIFLVYLNQLEKAEGPGVFAEDWVMELCGKAWLSLRRAAASPKLAAARSSLIRSRHLGGHDRALAAWIADTDPLRDYDWASLPRDLDSPLSLLRLQAAAEIPSALLQQIDRDLDPERGSPLSRNWQAGELARLAAKLEDAAKTGTPGSARWCRFWSRLIALRQAFERGEEIELDLASPLMWRHLLGSSRIDDGGLRAASLCGQRYLRMSQLALPPPFQALLEVQPIFTQSEVHTTGESFFGLVCGDQQSSPYSGRILFSDARFGALGASASQPYFTEGKRLPKCVSWVQKALVWPDAAEVHFDGIADGFSSLQEIQDSNEVAFRPGAIGFATPLGHNRRCSHYGTVIFRHLKFRRIKASDAMLRQNGEEGREARLALSRNPVNLRLCLDTALAKAHWQRALELLDLIGTTDFPAGITRLDSVVELCREASLADERARAEEGLGQWAAAAKSRRRAHELSPPDDGAALIRRRCALIRAIVLAGGRQALPSLGHGLEIALEQESSLLRAGVHRAQAWIVWAAGHSDEASLQLQLSDKLAPLDVDDAELMRKHQP